MLRKIVSCVYIYKYVIKFYLTALFSLCKRIFTKSNVSKVLIIFTVGFVSRVIVSTYHDVNVFLEYYKSVSLIYY